MFGLNLKIIFVFLHFWIFFDTKNINSPSEVDPSDSENSEPEDKSVCGDLLAEAVVKWHEQTSNEFHNQKRRTLGHCLS